MNCLAQPGDVELLAPLVVDEILIRLLRSHIAPRVEQMGFSESSVCTDLRRRFPGCAPTSLNP